MQYTGLVLGPGILLLYNKLAKRGLILLFYPEALHKNSISCLVRRQIKAAYTIRLSPEAQHIE